MDTKRTIVNGSPHGKRGRNAIPQTLGDVSRELFSNGQPADHALCSKRRIQCLADLGAIEGRHVIHYYSAFKENRQLTDQLSISDADVDIITQLCRNANSTALDFILHSPGGRLNPVITLIQYLRAKFDHIRIIIPRNTLSTSTLIACSGDEIMMADHSFLSPLDILFPTPADPINFSFGSLILDRCKLSSFLSAIPISTANNMVHSSWLENVRKEVVLAKDLLRIFLKERMFASCEDKCVKAAEVADWLVSLDHHKIPDRPISARELRSFLVKVIDLGELVVEYALVMGAFNITRCEINFLQIKKLISSSSGDDYRVYSNGAETHSQVELS